MEDRDWLILQNLYNKKNITKTAKELFISQPALTARLRSIESEFGVKIVQRTSKGVHFTPEGEYLAKSANKFLLELRNIKNNVLTLSNNIAGTLSIGSSNYLTMYTLPPLLQKFKQLYPKVEFKVNTTWSKDIFDLAYNQNVHVGFVSIDYGGFTDKFLLYEEAICLASTTDINIEDIPFLPRLDYHSDHLLKAQIDKWWREKFSTPPMISMHVDKLATCKEMLTHGLGYAIMPTRILNDVPNIKRINLMYNNGQPLTRKTWMIFNPEVLNIKLVSLFINFVKQQDF